MEPMSDTDDTYGYCNSCGEEMWLGDECCEDGEWVEYDLVADQIRAERAMLNGGE